MINSFQNKIITELPDIAKIDFKNINRNVPWSNIRVYNDAS